MVLSLQASQRRASWCSALGMYSPQPPLSPSLSSSPLSLSLFLYVPSSLLCLSVSLSLFHSLFFSVCLSLVLSLFLSFFPSLSLFFSLFFSLSLSFFFSLSLFLFSFRSDCVELDFKEISYLVHTRYLSIGAR